MKKLYTLAIALLASLAFTAPAHAFLIDGFGDDQFTEVEVFDETERWGVRESDTGETTSTTDSSGIGDAVGPVDPVTDTDLENAIRDLQVTKTDGANKVEMLVQEGQLQYSQDTQTSATGQVDWTGFDSVAFDSPINILLNVIEADRAGAELTFTLTNSEGDFTSVITLPEVNSASSFLFSISGFDTTDPFTSASLFIDGSELSALDLTVDFIEVPAPGVLGLLGIGLVGLGYAARRRRSDGKGIIG